MKNKKVYFHRKFVGTLNKKGNKNSAKRIFVNALHMASRRLKMRVDLLLSRVFLKLNTYIETKSIRIRKKSHLVPFATKFKRRVYLAIKWIMLSVAQDKRKFKLSVRLAFEMMNLIKKPSSKSLTLKRTNISNAYTNRSNLHFRW